MKLPVNEKQVARFARGFKTWAENTAVLVRSQLDVKPYAPLCPDALAKHLAVRLWTPADVPGLPAASLAYLGSQIGDEWSAIAVRVGSLDVVVTNDSHLPARRASDVMHELSHLLCKHKEAQIFISEETGVRIRTYNALQEAEADWLAGCLLLPRPALVHAATRKMTKQQACNYFGVSEEMYTYRMNITAVSRQFNYSWS